MYGKTQNVSEIITEDGDEPVLQFKRLKSKSPLSDKEYDVTVSGHAEIKSSFYVNSIAPSAAVVQTNATTNILDKGRIKNVGKTKFSK